MSKEKYYVFNQTTGSVLECTLEELDTLKAYLKRCYYKKEEVLVVIRGVELDYNIVREVEFVELTLGGEPIKEDNNTEPNKEPLYRLSARTPDNKVLLVKDKITKDEILESLVPFCCGYKRMPLFYPVVCDTGEYCHTRETVWYKEDGDIGLTIRISVLP